MQTSLSGILANWKRPEKLPGENEKGGYYLPVGVSSLYFTASYAKGLIYVDFGHNVTPLFSSAHPERRTFFIEPVVLILPQALT